MVSYLIILNCNDPGNAKILTNHGHNVVFSSFREAEIESKKIDQSTGSTKTRLVAL